MDTSPLGAIGTLYVMPIALLAVTRGVKGGIGGVATALALTVAALGRPLSERETQNPSVRDETKIEPRT